MLSVNAHRFFAQRKQKMAVEKNKKVDNVNVKHRNIVLVGIKIDESGKEILKWALEDVAEYGDCVVVVVHVCSTSHRALKSKPSLDQYLEHFSEFCSTKKIELKREVVKGNSVQGVLVKEAKRYNVMSIVVGAKHQRKLSLKVAKGCAKELPPTTDVLAIHRGNIVFRRSNHYQPLLGQKTSSRPSSYDGFSDKENELKSEESTVKSREVERTSQEKRKVSGRSLSLPSVEVVDQKPGWPLLRTTTLATTPMVQHHTRKISVVNWVMSLPERFPHHPNLTSQPSFCDSQLKDILKEINRWFSYDVLKTATSDFSSENLIGKGGCNEVYKGVLEDGKAVAVKILKSSLKEAVKDFVQEVSIISSLCHHNISPLIGVCVQHNDLISVYNLSSRGSLEETLQAKHVLRWEERFKIAIGLGGALDYLHNQCSNPVIHRDVKSSNVLLSDEFEPQAKPLIEKGDPKELLDPNISGTFDEAQFQKMVLAASYCLTRAATHRPNIREILKLLRGEDEVEKWVKKVEDDEDCFDDEVYPNSNTELHLSLAMLDVEDNDSVSVGSLERSNNSLFSSSPSSQELQS
ncbi:unnamed protein product [Thlaspi arvense]|uniref:Protein kinase domain-containing protein n=1 Tax=Thlaspi arvense TaxID=13288 RepID=A0AAU9RYF2_THLAR|nr:unnamed protein product [Thlaspi arvense]